MPSGRGQSSRSRTHRHARGGTDRQTAPAVGEGRAYRGAKVRRVSWRRRDGTTSHSAVRRAASPRGEGSPGARSSPAPRTGRAPLPGCRWVCPWVYGSPRLRAATQRPSNFQRCPAPRPRRRRSVSIVGPRARAQSAGLRRPMALAARARAPRLRCRRLSSAAPPLFSCCHSALSPALSSAPCPAALAAGPEPPRAGSAATFPAPLALGSLPLSGLCLSNGLSCLPRSRCLPLLWSLSSPGSPSQSVSPLPPSASALSRPCASPSPARSVLCLSRLCTLGAARTVSDPGPSRCRVPGSPGSPSSRRPRRAENSQLAARRPALRDFRPSSHVTRGAPLRSPPHPGSPRLPAVPGPAPSPLPSRTVNPFPPARFAGQGQVLGAAWARSYHRSCQGFSCYLQKRSSQNPFRKAAAGFSSPPFPPPLAPRGRWKGFLVLGRQCVGEGPYWVLWRWATPMNGPLSLLKYLQFRILRIPLRRRRWPC